MDKRIIPLKQKTITDCIGIYYRALETEFFVYFVNFHEGDESGVAKMYRKEDGSLSLDSNIYFAYVGLDEDLTEENYTWISKRLKKNWELYKEEQEKEAQAQAS